MKKRLLRNLLTLSIMIVMMLAITFTAEAYVHPVYVGGTNVVTGSGITYWLNDASTGGIISTGADENNYNVKYDSSTGGTSTLTLNGAAISKYMIYSNSTNYAAGICTSGGDLNIKVLNNNTIAPISSSYYNNECGIYAESSKITISGSGTLTVTAAPATNDKNSYGIYINNIYNMSEQTTTISGVKITVAGGDSKDGSSYGILTYGNLEISGGTVEATGSTAGDFSQGIMVSGVLSINGSAEVTATGGNSTGHGFSSYGIKSVNYNSSISDSTVIAISGNAASDSYGIYTGSKKLSITNGTVTAKTNSSSATNRAAINSAPNLTGYTGVTTVAGDSESRAKVVTSYNSEKYVKFGTMNTYTITYNNNNGSGSMTGETAAAGVGFPLPACGFVPPSASQEFYKWAVGSLEGTQIAANESYTFTGNTTVYAVWTRINDTPNATFTATGADTGTLTDVLNGMKYSIDGGTNWTTITSTAMNITGVTTISGIKVYKPGNGTTTTDSDIQTITVTKEAAPSAGKTDCTTLSNNDGKLTGVTAAMEYKLSTALVWNEGTGGDITGLANGTYYVRVKATGTVLASENQVITIMAYTAPPSSGGSSHSSSTVSDNPVITVSEVKSKIFSNAKDIKVEADVKSAFGQSVTVKLTDDAESQKEIFSLAGDNDRVYPFDISLYSKKNNEKIQPKEGYSVKITLPVPEELLNDKENIKVVYGKDGSLETLKSNLLEKDGKWYITFEAVHFSPYALIVSTEPAKSWANPFSDVKEDDWYYSAVQYAVQNGLMNGTDSNTFSHGNATSRGMIATILYRQNGSVETEQSSFKDVNPNAYYANAVAWAQQKGIITGYGNGMFGPDDSITREQLSYMLWKYAGSPTAAGNKELDTFKDAKEISLYAKNALIWANQLGIINGKGCGLLDPKGKATRAEVAQIIQNFMQKSSLTK